MFPWLKKLSDLQNGFNNITMEIVNSNVLLFVRITQKMTPED
jgi:hypothetical protein